MNSLALLSFCALLCAIGPVLGTSDPPPKNILLELADLPYAELEKRVSEFSHTNLTTCYTGGTFDDVKFDQLYKALTSPAVVAVAGLAPYLKVRMIHKEDELKFVLTEIASDKFADGKSTALTEATIKDPDGKDLFYGLAELLVGTRRPNLDKILDELIFKSEKNYGMLDLESGTAA